MAIEDYLHCCVVFKKWLEKAKYFRIKELGMKKEEFIYS